MSWQRRWRRTSNLRMHAKVAVLFDRRLGAHVHTGPEMEQEARLLSRLLLQADFRVSLAQVGSFL